ncbi:MAG: glycosyltransferase family 2 protein [Syntrophales bacterium]
MRNAERPLITTIIPTFRRPKLLRRAILSVLKQTYPNFQVCVYDNASCDETVEVVAEFMRQDKRVTYYAHNQNIGAMENFQYGYDRVATPYFSFLSDDNFLFPGFYEQAIQYLEEHSQDMMYCTPMLAGNDKWGVELLAAWPEGRYSQSDALMRLWENIIVWDSVLFRSDIRKVVKTFSGYYSDLSLIMQCASQHSFYVSKNSGACEIWTMKNISANMKMHDIKDSLLHLKCDIIDNGNLPDEIRKASEQAWRKMAIGRYYRMSAKKFMEGDAEQVRLAQEYLYELGAYRQAMVVKIFYCLNKLGTPFSWVAIKAIMAYKHYFSWRFPKLTYEEICYYQQLLDGSKDLYLAGK